MTGGPDQLSAAVATHHLPGARASPAAVREGARQVAALPHVGSLLESMPGPAAVLNRSRQILAANRRLLDDFGYAAIEEVLGRRPGEAAECVGVEDAPSGCGTGHRCAHCGCVNTVADCMARGEPASGECRIRRTDGGALDLVVSAAPTVLGDLPVVFVGMRDVSAERRREVLERAFFHDVLNTTGAIQGLLELADRAEDVALRREARTSLSVLTDQLILEIQSHRQLCDAEAGRLEPHLAPASLPQLLRGVRDRYAHHDLAHARSLVVDLPADVVILTDPALFRRVLGNMLKNALEATPRGGTVRMWAEVEGNRAAVSVRNPGVMPEDVRLQVFQRSFSTKGVGRGVGTYGMKLLGERILGGHVEFVSQEPEGTTFTFRVAGVREDGDAPVDPFDGAGARVLVADDSGINRWVLLRLLRERGCRVVEASNADEAIDAVAAGDVDLVLTDLVMPGRSGLEVARTIRSAEAAGDPRLPVVVLTGSADRKERQACIDAGADEALEKPIRPEELTRLLARYLPASSPRP